MKARSAAIALIMALILSLHLIAPASAASDKAQIRSVIKNYITLLAKGDIQGALQLKIRKQSIPPRNSFEYRMITKLAGAFTGIGQIRIKGDRAWAVLNFDPKVAADLAQQDYAFALDQAKKITDPQPRADTVGHLKKNRDREIAKRMKSFTQPRMRLQKISGHWMIR